MTTTSSFCFATISHFTMSLKATILTRTMQQTRPTARKLYLHFRARCARAAASCDNPGQTWLGRCLVLRQQYALKMLPLLESGRRIINVDESWLNGTNFVRGSDYVCDFWHEQDAHLVRTLHDLLRAKVAALGLRLTPHAAPWRAWTSRQLARKKG